MNNCIPYKSNTFDDNFCSSQNKTFFLDINHCSVDSKNTKHNYYIISTNFSDSADSNNINFTCSSHISVSRYCGTPINDQNNNVIRFTCNETAYCIDSEGNGWKPHSKCSSWAGELYLLGSGIAWFSTNIMLSTIPIKGLFLLAPNLEDGDAYVGGAVFSLIFSFATIEKATDYLNHQYAYEKVTDVFNDATSYIDHFCQQYSTVCNTAAAVMTGLVFTAVTLAFAANMPHVGSIGLNAAD